MHNEDLNHWIISDPTLLGDNVAGLRAPDEVVAMVIEGFATDNAVDFEYPPFGAGRMDAIFIVLDKERADPVFTLMGNYVRGRKGLKENLNDENEVVAARWNLANDQVALLVADSGACENAQDAFEQALGFNGIHVYRSENVVVAPQFDAKGVLSKPDKIFSDNVRQVLTDLQHAAPSAKASKTSRSAKP